jgi:hypothetical protein
MTDLKERESLPGFEERLLGELLELVERRNAGNRPATPRPRRRRPLWVLGAAAVVALVVAIAIPAVLPEGGPGSADPAAAAALHRLGRIARHHRTIAAPQAGQFVYTRSRYTETMLVGSTELGGDYRYVESAERQIWIGPDGSGRLVEIAGDISFPTPADEEAWRAAGSPDLGGGSGSDETYEAGGLYFQDLSGFSTDPNRLEPQMEAFAKSRNESTFEAAGELLRETYAPPELRSAIFDVVANLPDVQYLGTVTDAAGRSGIGIAEEQNGWTNELIFDAKTSALLGESSVGEPGTSPMAGESFGIDWATAYLESSVTGSIGPDSIPGAGPRVYCQTVGPYASRCSNGP